MHVALLQAEQQVTLYSVVTGGLLLDWDSYCTITLDYHPRLAAALRLSPSECEELITYLSQLLHGRLVLWAGLIGQRSVGDLPQMVVPYVPARWGIAQPVSAGATCHETTEMMLTARGTFDNRHWLSVGSGSHDDAQYRHSL